MEVVTRELPFNDWTTISLLVIIFFLAISKVNYPNRFTDFLSLSFNNKYLMVYNKEKKLTHPFNIVMTGLKIIIITLYIMIVFKTFQIDFLADNQYRYIIIAIIIGLAAAAKILLQKIIADIFTIDTFISSYIFSKVSYSNIASFVLFIGVIVFSYIIPPNKTSLAITACIYLIIIGVGWVKTIFSAQNLIVNYLFYFILYLCALEIAPYLIGYSIVVN